MQRAEALSQGNNTVLLISSRRRAFGLGSGQRRSLAFEDFVLKNRRVLREELKLCERATQRILGYSNNFLHKKLKTSSQVS